MTNRPQIIAHRGGAGLWPENTMAAFARALDMGCDGMELDCHLTADGEVVVFHDEALKPDIVRDATGRYVQAPTPLIKSMSLAETQSYDVGRLRPGSPYAAKHPDQIAIDGERIPRLRDVIRLTKSKSPNAKLWIEMKTALMEPERSAAPEKLADRVLDCLYAEDFAHRAVLISFDWRTLRRAQARDPNLETRYTTLPQTWFGEGPIPAGHEPPKGKALDAIRATVAAGAPWEAGFHPKDHGGLRPAIKAAGGGGWFPFFPDITPETAAETKRLGLTLAAWTVDDESDMRRLMALGCDALCTDRPDRLRRLLATD